MNKTKLLGIAVITLLLLNFGMLWYLFFNYTIKKNRKMPREVIIEKLHFDKNQIAKYDVTIKKHQKSIKQMDDSIRISKNKLYTLLNNEKINVLQKDSLLVQIAQHQKKIETIHFEHFLEIKAICTKNQLKDFNEVTQKLSKLFSPPRKPKHE